ncbi:hypothetical protein JKP88DRAFT_218600 [Tribonema minus]|uniref:MYND-type domain-containing protein n=1 Tax=Tribonema minus TaxID=303371 RepID=A0A835ZBY0_9STRA|nr:hypothetical protein JKP88DRAFT_218600 [Tribonema minus]
MQAFSHELQLHTFGTLAIANLAACQLNKRRLLDAGAQDVCRASMIAFATSEEIQRFGGAALERLCGALEASSAADRASVATSQHFERLCSADGCDAAGTKKCGACKMVYYCSAECQSSHWPAHKRQCRNNRAAK